MRQKVTGERLGLGPGFWGGLVQQAFGCLTVGLLLAGSGWALRHGDPVVTVVNTPEVNVRSAPRVGGNTFLQKVPRGAQLKRIGERGTGSEKWYQVVLTDGRTAWVHSKYAKPEIARDLLEVKVAQARVRQSPTTAKGSKVMGIVKRGDMLSLVRERSRWYRAILPNGRQGWIHQNLVVRRPIGPPEPADTPPSPPSAPKPEPEAVESPPEKAPESPVDSFQRGLDLAAEKRVDEAIEAFQKALEARPDDGAANFELALLLKEKDKQEESIAHFRKALKARPEAKFYIDAMLKAPADSTAPEDEDRMEGELGQGEGAWTDIFQMGASYLLPGLAVGSLVFLVALGLVFYRRRRGSGMERPAYRRRKRDAGFDAVLKYAVEKRPLLRAIEEAERKRAEMDDALQQRFSIFDKQTQEGGGLPAGESSETLLSRVEDLRKTILNQEERAQIYADLVVLQNEKLDTLDEEIEALKKLIQLDYRDVKKGAGQGSGAAKGSD